MTWLPYGGNLIHMNTTHRIYNNFTKTYDRFTVTSQPSNGYVWVRDEDGTTKRMPVAAVALAEVVR